jgi:hypothetical protein
MQKGLVLGSILALSMAGSAMAEGGFDYSYVELGYMQTEIDDFDVDGDGFGLRGSLEVTDNFHVFATYANQDFDYDVSSTTFEVGAGYAWALNPNLDLVGSLSYVKAELEVPFFGDFDDDGFALGAGVRGRPMDQLELTAGLKFTSFDEGGDDTAVAGGARYFLTDAFAVGLDVEFDDDATTWMIGGRLSFGQ